MNWFKHDADATTDAKIKKLLIKYGAVGYAVYFHCLELIASNISETNITFELEHDAEIIADDLRIKGDNNRSGTEIVEEIMKFMVSLNLFEESNGHIFCFKLLKRLDYSQCGVELRKVVKKAKEELENDEKMTESGTVMISHDEYRAEEIRRDKIRRDKIRKDKNSKSSEKKSDETKIKSDAVTLLKSWNDNYIIALNHKPDDSLDKNSKDSFWKCINKQLQNKLKEYDLETLLKTVEYAKSDPWILKNGFSVNAVFCDSEINKAIQNSPTSFIQSVNDRVKKDLQQKKDYYF